MSLCLGACVWHSFASDKVLCSALGFRCLRCVQGKASCSCVRSLCVQCRRTRHAPSSCSHCRRRWRRTHRSAHARAHAHSAAGRLRESAQPLQGWAQRCCTCAGTAAPLGPSHCHIRTSTGRCACGRLGSSAVGVRWGRCCCARVPTRQRSARRPSSGCGRVRALEWCTHAQCFMLYAATCRIVLQHVASCCNIVRHVALDRLSVQLRGRATRKRPSRSPRSASPPELPTETPTRRSARSGSAWPSALPAAY